MRYLKTNATETGKFNKTIATETIRFIVTAAIVVYQCLISVVYRMLTLFPPPQKVL